MYEFDENHVIDDEFDLAARNVTITGRGLIGKNLVRKIKNTYETGKNDEFDFDVGSETIVGKDLIEKKNGILGKKDVRETKQIKRKYETVGDDDYDMEDETEMATGRYLNGRSEERSGKKLGRKPKPKNNDSYEKQLLSGGISGSCAMKLWKELSNDYKIFVKKYQKAVSGSGVSELPSFRYASYMSFLDVAAEKRQVKNAFIIGSSGHYTAESDNDFGDDKKAEEEEDVLNENSMDGLKLETPKRKRSYAEMSTPKKPRRQTQVDELLKKLDESNCSIMTAVNDMKKESSCNTERLCKTFQKLT
ncbi:hypothetical protein GCK72_019986 [Caenorhabditis remanei]|uniref:Uncharacterized protein n=1 Tax=Caenorhabditis remanei TaxID=31234 RepID=A0A6A5GG97_CAERE|nr:hypothetical protein GCK72_019986 [Caenorhabditis remanei]KAF1753429.1 hypothetical protein GCK72_019986 [Caenorhabditis remanei]